MSDTDPARSAENERHHGHIANTPECWDKCGDPATDPTHPADYELGAEEFAAMVEEQAQRYLGMTTTEFVEAVRRGEPPDHPATAHLIIMTGARIDGTEGAS